MLLKAILILAALAAVVFLFFRIAPEKSRLLIEDRAGRFPLVSGYNLNRVEFTFPQDFGAENNLLIIPFLQSQQLEVNTWIPELQQIEAETESFIYYELPTISAQPRFSRTFINEGMRAGIPDATARERTITLYLNKDMFKEAVQIDTEEEIHLLLVGSDGTILWRTRGSYTSEKAAELRAFLQQES